MRFLYFLPFFLGSAEESELLQGGKGEVTEEEVEHDEEVDYSEPGITAEDAIAYFLERVDADQDARVSIVEMENEHKELLAWEAAERAKKELVNLDVDGDGLLSLNETLPLFGIEEDDEMSAEERHTLSLLNEMFVASDTNKDGLLDYVELVGLLLPQLVPAVMQRTSEVELAHREGAEKDGKLTWEEFRDSQPKQEEELSEEELKKEFGYIDSDSDGFLSISEFSQYLSIDPELEQGVEELLSHVVIRSSLEEGGGGCAQDDDEDSYLSATEIKNHGDFLASAHLVTLWDELIVAAQNYESENKANGFEYADADGGLPLPHDVEEL